MVDENSPLLDVILLFHQGAKLLWVGFNLPQDKSVCMLCDNCPIDALQNTVPVYLMVNFLIHMVTVLCSQPPNFAS